MSASTLRNSPAPDRNVALREQVFTLAQRHKRYSAGMIYLKLRQASHRVNHRRVDRLYAVDKLHDRRHRNPSAGLLRRGH